MKRYMNFMLVALVASCGLSTNFAFGVPVRTVPVTEGEESIVSAIKANSNLTEADVNKYKLLWLGSAGNFAAFNVDTLGAFIAGAAAAVGIGTKTYQGAELIKGSVSEYVPS